MPLPTPNKDETHDDFNNRCMDDETMRSDFPETAQRFAVCSRQWDDAHKGNSRSWYEIRNAASDVTDVYLYDEIGSFGVSSKAFIDALNSVKTPSIQLYVNSPGGTADDGVAIFNALQRHPASITAIVDGSALSAASYVVQAADKRMMGKGSMMMIHEPHAMAIGDAETAAKMAEYLNTVGDSIAGIYAERAGGTVADWRAAMKAETWYKAQDAVDAGLADEVVGAVTGATNLAGRVFNLSKFHNVPEWATQSVAPAEDAGRTMSQANLGQLHGAMQSMQDLHAATCDMGDKCPMDSGASNTATPAAAIVTPAVALEAKRWPLLVHHEPTGAVNQERLAIALTRVHDLNVTVHDREEAIRHLEGHASQRGSRAA